MSKFKTGSVGLLPNAFDDVMVNGSLYAAVKAERERLSAENSILRSALEEIDGLVFNALVHGEYSFGLEQTGAQAKTALNRLKTRPRSAPATSSGSEDQK